MQILIIHQAFAALDEAGGTRHYEMAQHLVRRGHQVTIIASPISYLTGRSRTERIPWLTVEEPEPGIRILRTYTYRAFHKSFVHRVFSFLSFMVSAFLVGLRQPHIDLVWGTSPPIFQGVTAWLIARLKGIPFLFEVRDLWPAFAIAVGVLKNRLIIRPSLWLERFLYTHADVVMVNSPGYIDHVKERGAKQVELIPNGVDPDMFAVDPAQRDRFREQHQLADRFVVTYAGAHGISNDLHIVLDAAQLCSDHENICFLLVGDGKEKPNLQQSVTEMGLKNVIFLPPVAKKEMTAVLAGSDACLAILKPIEMYKTTYPNKVFDYMAAARPVVLAIDGVIREVVEEAQGGIFVQPGNPQAMADAVIHLATHPEDSRHMGERGCAHVSAHFNRGAITDTLALLLEQMEQTHGRKNRRR